MTSCLLPWVTLPSKNVSTLNPVALRKAKIVCILAFLSAIGLRKEYAVSLTLLHSEWSKTSKSFGHFECKRVKEIIILKSKRKK